MPVARQVWQRAWSAQVAAAFTATPADRVARLLATLVMLDQARLMDEGQSVG